MACVSSIANSFGVWTRAFTVPGQSIDVDEAQLGLVAQLNRFFAVNNSITIAALSFFSASRAVPDGGQPSHGVRLTLMSGGVQYSAREFDDGSDLEAYLATNGDQWPAHVFALTPIGTATGLARLVGVFADRNRLHVRARRPQVIPVLADEVVGFFDNGAFEVDVPQSLTDVIRGANLGNADWPLGGLAPMAKTPQRNTWAGVAPCAYAGAGPSEVQPLPDCDFLNNCCGDLEPLSGSTGIVRDCTVCQDPDTPGSPALPSASLPCDWNTSVWADSFVNFSLNISGGVGEYGSPLSARNGNTVAILGFKEDVAGSDDELIVRYSTDGVNWEDDVVLTENFSSRNNHPRSLIYDPALDQWVVYDSFITLGVPPRLWIKSGSLGSGSWTLVDLSSLTQDEPGAALFYAGGRYFILPADTESGSDRSLPYTSTDAVNWTLSLFPTDRDVSGLAYTGMYWVTLSGWQYALRTTDGVNWTEVTVGGGYTLRPNPWAVDLVYGGRNGRIVSVQEVTDANNTQILYSDDEGASWSSAVLDASIEYDIRCVRHIDGLFLACATEKGGVRTTTLFTSIDGITWAACLTGAINFDVTRITSLTRWVIQGGSALANNRLATLTEL